MCIQVQASMVQSERLKIECWDEGMLSGSVGSIIGSASLSLTPLWEPGVALNATKTEVIQVSLYSFFFLASSSFVMCILCNSHRTPAFLQLKDKEGKTAGTIHLDLTCTNEEDAKEDEKRDMSGAEEKAKEKQDQTEANPQPASIEEEKASGKMPAAAAASSTVVLRISEMKANDLKNTEWLGKMDPYLKISLDKQHHHTHHINEGGRSVSWGKAVLEFETSSTILDSHQLQVDAWDKGMTSDTLIGSASLSFAELLGSLGSSQTFDLQVRNTVFSLCSYWRCVLYSSIICFIFLMSYILQLKKGKNAAGMVHMSITCFNKSTKGEKKESDINAQSKASANEVEEETSSGAGRENDEKAVGKTIEKKAAGASSTVILRVSEMKANDLRNTEWLGKMDPYLKISLDKQHQHTHHINEGGRSVSWGKSVLEFETSPSVLDSHQLHVEAVDKGITSDTLIGSATLSVAELLDSLGSSQTFDLQVRNSWLVYIYRLHDHDAQLFMPVCLSPTPTYSSSTAEEW